jgi:hypothetical protein
MPVLGTDPAIGTALDGTEKVTLGGGVTCTTQEIGDLGANSFTGGALTSALDEAKGANIASAATTDIGAATGNLVHITGTVTITSLGTAQAGARRVVIFDGALILTHNATSLILPGGANITTAAGDSAVFVSESSGNWRCAGYQRASFFSGAVNLATIAGLTATTDNFMQAKSGAWASRTVAQVTVDLQGTGLLTDAVGFRTIPQNSQSADYTCVAADSGKHILHPTADTTPRTFTIPANSSVAYPVGTAITFINQNGAGTVTIGITTDTMRLAGAGTTGNRTLAANGVATAIKTTSTTWIISGTGLT